MKVCWERTLQWKTRVRYKKDCGTFTNTASPGSRLCHSFFFFFFFFSRGPVYDGNASRRTDTVVEYNQTRLEQTHFIVQLCMLDRRAFLYVYSICLSVWGSTHGNGDLPACYK